MDTRTRIAWNLRHIRSSKKISQEHLAVDARVDRTAISGIERGEYNPSVDLLDRLVPALGVRRLEARRVERPCPYSTSGG
ncbi:MAG: helix-turn-helix transcriptional regulator [Ensifer adhaerens]